MHGNQKEPDYKGDDKKNGYHQLGRILETGDTYCHYYFSSSCYYYYYYYSREHIQGGALVNGLHHFGCVLGVDEFHMILFK